ncbi:hypothetical protein BDV06DRAFT_218347 [Aspergillus oleicola]
MTPFSTIVSLIVTSFLLWASETSAVIIGPDVSTIFNSDDLEHCLPNFTDKGLVSTSTAPFTSEFLVGDSSPLTWTQAIRVNPHSDPSLENQVTVHREFYFGYAPTNSSDSPESDALIRACSIFFFDASALYGVSELSDTEIDWSRELPTECVANLTTHLDDAARIATIDSDDDLRTFCRNQQVGLLDYYVHACEEGRYSVRLSDIKAFTTTPSQPGNCTLANDSNYNIRQMNFLKLSAENGTSKAKQLVQGATPIITMIFPHSKSNETEPETHYVALRAEENVLPRVGGNGDGGSQASKVSPTYFVMFSWFVGVFFAVLEYAS